MDEIKSLEAAAAELLKWPKSAKRDAAVAMFNKAAMGTVVMAKAEKAFMEAARHANVLLSRGW